MARSQEKEAQALGLIRIAVGLIFVAHGALKVFVMGYGGVTGFLTQLGIPFPAVAALCTMAAECVGGLLLTIGVLTPLVSLALAFNMVVAILTAKRDGGFYAPQGAEFELLLAVSALALAWSGPGAFSSGRKSA